MGEKKTDQIFEDLQEIKKSRRWYFSRLKRWPVLERGVYLYILRDYFTGDVRYVGQTNNPLKRMRVHMRSLKWYRDPFSDWKRKHYREGLLPDMEILAIVENKIAFQQEMALIHSYLASGVELFNTVKQWS